MPFIQVDELWKVYKMADVEVRALRGLSLDMEEGELVSLIGPSGSGKTTLLSIIGGLLPPTTGTVQVGDVVVTDLNEENLSGYRLRRVGHIFQTLNLVSFLSAAENIALPMITLGMPSHERTERVNELLNAMNLESRHRHRPYELSGGELQRVAIASALANNPPLILADEPTGELDTETAQEIVEYLQRIHEEQSKTILLVTHDPAVARIGGRVLRMKDGQLKGNFLLAFSRDEGNLKDVQDFLQTRLTDVESALSQLDESMRKETISSEEYARQRRKLSLTKQTLSDELHRLGI